MHTEPKDYKMGQVIDKTFNGLKVPQGEKITFKDGKPIVPAKPIIPFIEGDGTGRDIWKASQRVFDAAVKKAYGDQKAVAWFEVFAGEKAKNEFDNWLPEDTLAALKEFGRHQRTADHTRRRRHPQPERELETDLRPVLLCQTGALL
jgi:hypothetical protein